jgi:hypothetical protein
MPDTNADANRRQVKRLGSGHVVGRVRLAVNQHCQMKRRVQSGRLAVGRRGAISARRKSSATTQGQFSPGIPLKPFFFTVWRGSAAGSTGTGAPSEQ